MRVLTRLAVVLFLTLQILPQDAEAWTMEDQIYSGFDDRAKEKIWGKKKKKKKKKNKTVSNWDWFQPHNSFHDSDYYGFDDVFDPAGIVSNRCLPGYRKFYRSMERSNIRGSMSPCRSRKSQVAKKIRIIVDKAGKNDRKDKGPKQTVVIHIEYANGKKAKWGPWRVSTGSIHWALKDMKKDYAKLFRKKDRTDEETQRLEQFLANIQKKWPKSRKRMWSLLRKMNWKTVPNPKYYFDKYATPEGVFNLKEISFRRAIVETQAYCVQNKKSSSYGTAMPYASGIYGGYYFHSGFPGGVTGSPRSHGCVRMYHSHSRRLYCLLRQKGYGSEYKGRNELRTIVEIIADGRTQEPSILGDLEGGND